LKGGVFFVFYLILQVLA